MILLENLEIVGLEPAIRGMRNPMNSWDKSDSGTCKGGDLGIGCRQCQNQDICNHTYDGSFQIGKGDYSLMVSLAKQGSVHGKFLRMISVYVDITAPLYWWKEFDTYKVGTVANSCSTMHKIHAKKFDVNDFSHEHLLNEEDVITLKDISSQVVCSPIDFLKTTIDVLNHYRDLYLETKEKKYWWQMIQLLPTSYNQRRTVMLNYEVLSGIYYYRKGHKLDEWNVVCDWVEALPYGRLLTCFEE